MPKTPNGSWACLFPLSLLSGKRAVWHELTGEQDGEEVLLLAQLRSRLETSSKRIPPDKRILFPTPHSLPCSPVGGTDVPSSQYSWDGMVLSTKNRRKKGWEGRWRKILVEAMRRISLCSHRQRNCNSKTSTSLLPSSIVPLAFASVQGYHFFIAGITCSPRRRTVSSSAASRVWTMKY